MDLVGLNFQTGYVERRVEKGIRSRMILSAQETTPQLREFLSKDEAKLRETVMIQPHEYPFDSVIAVTKGLVILINSESNPFAVLIRNEHIAATLASIHRIIWNRYVR